MRIASGCELLDDLPTAQQATYVLDQVVRYAYPGAAHNLHQQLIIVPPSRHGDQVRAVDRFSVGCTTPTWSRRLTDRFGNTVLYVRAPRVDHLISFEMQVVVERGVQAPLVERWSARHRTQTARTTPDENLRDVAADLQRRVGAHHAGDLVDLVVATGAHVHASMRYAKGVTDVATTAAEAWAAGAGVCQDMAHVMVVLCRLNGIAARYVSGHLVGEGASHAWVEAFVERDGRREIVAFDPTHDRRTDLRYLTVAVGRDYGDVAPTSGTYEAELRGELAITKALTVTAIA